MKIHNHHTVIDDLKYIIVLPDNVIRGDLGYANITRIYHIRTTIHRDNAVIETAFL